jgi:hypothetical protein
MEKIWRRHACVARNAFILTLRYVISGIVANLDVKRHARGSGKKRSWQTTATIERTRQRHRDSGEAETRITGSSTAREIRPTWRGIVWVRRSATDGDDPGQGLQKWTS